MLKKRLISFRFAFAGAKELVRTQPNAKIHLFAACAVVAAGFYFEISAMEWCVAILAITLVLSAEAFNTAIENLTDLVSPGFHPLAGKTKDVAAAAVLIVAIGAALAGGIIFFPKILRLIGY